jgi:tetratricopeptide (TPR) repeat protein
MLKAMPRSLEAKQQMLEESHLYYRGNATQLAIIDEFENNYRASNAIYWYTRSCFLFRWINEALRSHDIVTLYTFRYFIIDLCASLEAAHTDQLSTRVYRGAVLLRDEFETYGVGHLVAANSFLSTSRDLKTAQIFGGIDPATVLPSSRTRDDSWQHVLFEIDIDCKQSPNVILADITTQSVFPNEHEILFDMGTVFEIISIDYDCYHLWRIQMRTSAEVVHHSREYEYYICEQMKETNVDTLFGILLTDMGDYKQSLLYFKRLLRWMSPDHSDRADARGKQQTSGLQDFKKLHKTSQQRLQIFTKLQKTSKKLPKTSKDFQRLQKTSKDFKRLQETSRDFKRLQETSRDFKRLQGTSRDFKGLHETLRTSRNFTGLHGLHETS